MLSKEELIKQLNDIEKRQKWILESEDHLTGSFYEDHIHADRLLLQYINDKKVTESFDKIEKWYS